MTALPPGFRVECMLLSSDKGCWCGGTLTFVVFDLVQHIREQILTLRPFTRRDF